MSLNYEVVFVACDLQWSQNKLAWFWKSRWRPSAFFRLPHSHFRKVLWKITQPKTNSLWEHCVVSTQYLNFLWLKSYNFRLTSCQAANGLLILPGKTDTKTEAADGEEFDALIIGELRLWSCHFTDIIRHGINDFHFLTTALQQRRLYIDSRATRGYVCTN